MVFRVRFGSAHRAPAHATVQPAPCAGPSSPATRSRCARRFRQRSQLDEVSRLGTLFAISVHSDHVPCFYFDGFRCFWMFLDGFCIFFNGFGILKPCTHAVAGLKTSLQVCLALQQLNAPTDLSSDSSSDLSSDLSSRPPASFVQGL